MKWLEGMRDAIRARTRNILGEAAQDAAVVASVRNSTNHYIRALRALRSAHSVHVKRRRAFQVLRSFDARLCCLILGWKGPPVSFAEACSIAAALNPRHDCFEPVHFREEPKVDGGMRPIWSFRSQRRALQLIAKHTLMAQWAEPEFDFAVRGRGRDAAMDHVMQAIPKEGGPRWFLTADIKNCFGSFNKEMIPATIPLPANVVLNSILISESTLVTTDDISATSQKAVPSGLPQGSLASSYIATKLLEPVVAKLHGEVVASYADDILVGCRSKNEAEANKLLLGDLLADHPAGPLFMKSSVAPLGKPIDFLGYRLRRRWLCYGGGVRCIPSPKAFYFFELRLIGKLREAEPGQLERTAASHLELK